MMPDEVEKPFDSVKKATLGALKELNKLICYLDEQIQRLETEMQPLRQARTGFKKRILEIGRELKKEEHSIISTVRPKRNAEIWEKRKSGKTSKVLAQEYNLSLTTINIICHAQERKEHWLKEREERKSKEAL